MLFGQDLGGRHDGNLVAVFHRDDRGQERHDGLAGADVALQQALHRPRALQVSHNLRERLALPFRQLERQHRARTLADAIVDLRDQALAHLRVLVTPKRQPRLEYEEVLEHQPALRRRHERVQLIDVGFWRRKMRRPQRRLSTRPALTLQHIVRNRIELAIRQL